MKFSSIVCFCFLILLPMEIAALDTLQLTDSTYDSRRPTLSGNGLFTSFWSRGDLTGNNPDNFNQLFFMRTDGSELRQLTNSTGYSISSHMLSKNGSVVVFLANGDPFGANSDGNSELFSIRTDGTNLRQLTHSVDPAYIQRFGVSDNGEFVVLISIANFTGGNADGSQELFVINTDGSSTRQLTNNVSGRLDFNLSGDNNTIVYSNTDMNDSGIYTINRNGLNKHHISTETDPFNMYISANGRVVAFASNDDLLGTNPDHYYNIFTANNDGSNLIQATNAVSYGETISAFINNNSDKIYYKLNHQIYRSNLDGTDLRQITYLNQGAITNAIRISNADNVILYLVNAGGNFYEIHLQNTDDRDSIIVGTATVASSYDFPHYNLASNGMVFTLAANDNPLGTNNDGSFEVFVGIEDNPAVTGGSSGSGGGGGCAYNPDADSFDPLLPVLLIMSGLYFLRRRDT